MFNVQTSKSCKSCLGWIPDNTVSKDDHFPHDTIMLIVVIFPKDISIRPIDPPQSLMAV
jgi:hypothetical protein